MNSEWMTTEELAAMLRTSPSTIRYWRSRSYGPRGVRAGKRVLYSSREVERWLNEQADVPDRGNGGDPAESDG